MGLALLWLPASEAALIAYTMPVWASMLAWPILGERPNLLRVISLVMALRGPCRHHGRQRLCGERGKAAGNPHGARRLDRLCGRHGAWRRKCRCICRRSRPPPGRSGSAACRSRSSGLAIETTPSRGVVADSTGGSWSMRPWSSSASPMSAGLQHSPRLPASVAAIGTMAVPVIGVVASALALHEPLGAGPDRGAGLHAIGRRAGDAILIGTTKRVALGFARHSSIAASSDLRRKRLSQTIACAEFVSHPVKVGRGRLDIGKGIAGHRDQGGGRRALVESPDRLETAHMRHEDIDQHHVEDRAFERAQARFTAIGDGDFEALVLETGLNGFANHWVVIDHENTRHGESLQETAHPACAGIRSCDIKIRLRARVPITVEAEIGSRSRIVGTVGLHAVGDRIAAGRGHGHHGALIVILVVVIAGIITRRVVIARPAVIAVRRAAIAPPITAPATAPGMKPLPWWKPPCQPPPPPCQPPPRQDEIRRERRRRR